MSFTYNGVNCESFGMYVEEYPSRPFPQRKQTVYSVPGRTGNLIVDEDAYTNVVQEYKVFVKGTQGHTFQENLTLIANWLLTVVGYEVLRDSYSSNIYRNARITNAVEFLNSLNKFGKGTIQFDCDPRRYPYPRQSNEIACVSGETKSYTYASGTGLLPAYTTIRLEATTPMSGTQHYKIHAPYFDLEVNQTQNYSEIIFINFQNESVIDNTNSLPPQSTLNVTQWSKFTDGSTITLYNYEGTKKKITFYENRYSL